MEANQEIKNFLERTIQENRVAHAYIFLGEAGVGKEEIALWYEQKLNTEGGKIHPDRLLIKPQAGKRQISIEQIKEVRNWLKFSSHQAQRVVIINPAEGMNFFAQNALLKTLEEPTPNSVLILITNRVQGLTETILSRCQILRFRKTSQKEIRSWLKTEGLSKQKIEEIISLSQGKIKEIKFWLEHPEELLTELIFFQRLESLMNKNLITRLGWVDKLARETNFNRILNGALQINHDLLLKKGKTSDGDSSLGSTSDYSWSKLTKRLQIIQETKTLLETTNVNKKLAFNQLFINI